MTPAYLIDGDKRHLGRLALYSLPAIPLSIMIVPATALVPIFYTGTFGLDLALVGLVLLAVRLFDALTDPVAGYLSDRTRTPIGRRKPWLLAGAPILLIGVWLLFAPPLSPGLVFLAGASALTYLGWTLIQIPYWSWGAEIGRSYDERTTVSAFRESAMIFGIALASLAPIIAANYGYGIDRVTMFALAGLVTLLLPIALGLSMFSFREPQDHSGQAADWTALGQVLKTNAPFRRLVIAFAIIEFGKGASIAVMPYLLSYYFGQAELIGLVLLIPYVLIIASTPFWLMISRRVGKHKAIALSLFLSALLLSVAIVPLGREDGLIFLAIECAVGLTAGGFAVLPYAIVGDTADHYADQTGGDPMLATHFAAWSFVRKLMLALAVGIALPLLALAGFDPKAETVENVEATKWLFIALAAPFYLAGVALLASFPLTKEKHDAIVTRLASRTPQTASGETHGH
jgi:Na+/melibiose symporter-like transporter